LKAQNEKLNKDLANL